MLEVESRPMPPDRVVRHLRTPSIDKLKARVASLNCYASHEVDDGTPAASLLAIAPGTTETSSSSARSASSRSSRSATGHMRQSDGHLALPSHPRGVPHLRGRSGTAPETMAPAPEPLVRSVLAKLGECADGEPTDADDMPGWYEIRPTRFGVRSETYLADHRKVPSAGAIFRCVAVQLFTSDDLAEVSELVRHAPCMRDLGSARSYVWCTQRDRASHRRLRLLP
mmetsp:Transcript_11063/g.28781  ORF Transcript_11063/g.28781 Transcript_11063/m.28781 type:complete len:225 (-) Transcript_11063:582-1256(-)